MTDFFFQFFYSNILTDFFLGVRVQALAYRKDNRSILAADTHHCIQIFFSEILERISNILTDFFPLCQKCRFSKYFWWFFSGVRVQALAYRKDNRSILAADTHHRIRSYNLEDEQSDKTIIQESHGVMTFTIDESDRYALLNIASQVR